MQGLYETHKLLTYPRSDNRYLSDEHYYQAGDIATAIAATVPELASAIVDMDKGQKHKAFNASKIEAHHAIIPTTKSGAGIQLNEKERNVYNLVSVYFIGLFYPDAIRNKTKIHFDIKGIPLRPHRAFWYKRAGKRWVRIVMTRTKPKMPERTVLTFHC